MDGDSYSRKQLEELCECMIEYYEGDPKRIQHFIKVHSFAAMIGQKENLERLYKELLNKDWFMTFPDYQDYVETKDKAYAAYEDRKAWARMMLKNISQAGFFSSDRTIAQYNEDIWHLN